MKRVLIVDDDPQIRGLMQRVLNRDGYECTTTESAAEAHEQLGETDFQLAICDIGLGASNGLDLAREIQNGYPDTAVMMASGQDEPFMATAAMDRGALGYMVKPFSSNQLLIGVANALYRRRLELENDRYRERLEGKVADTTSELQETAAELSRSRKEAIHRLARAVELRDVETGDHIRRIGEFSAMIAERIHLDQSHVELIRVASPMHDVGKVGTPDSILLKPGKLTEDERLEMERHAQTGHDILAGSGAEMLDLAATIALSHHERMDGSGYPLGLRDEEIPIEGRIVAVADVFDALTSDRVYRKAFTVDKAIEMMREGRDTHFDPVPLDALLEDVEVFAKVRADCDLNEL